MIEKKFTILFISIFILSSGGLLFSLGLIITDFLLEGYCPLLFDIPACYIVFLCFLLVFISLFVKKHIRNFLILPGAGIGLTIAIRFSVAHFLQISSCPVLLNIPLCYLSLFVFIIITILFYIYDKKEIL